GVVRGGPEVLADALDEIRPARAARVHGALGVGADDLDVGVLLFEVLRDAGDGAARADPRDEVGDAPCRLPPDLRARAPLVGDRILGIVVLAGLIGAGDLPGQAVGDRVIGVGVVGGNGGRADDDLGAVG